MEGRVKMRRGIALTISLLLLVTSLIPIIHASTDLYYNRSQIIRANVEKNLAISEIEILKRILITDMLGALDLALSRGTVFKVSEKPEDIIGSILSNWISSISISSRKLEQRLQNLIIIGQGVRVSLRGTCIALASDLCSKHFASGTIVLRRNASVDYLHVHSWGNEDKVSSQYEFILEKGARLRYIYDLASPPRRLEMKTKVRCLRGSSADVKILISSNNSNVLVHDEVELLGKGASSMVSIRAVARNRGSVRALSSITALEDGKGHLDCRGLLLDDSSSIELVPKLLDKNKKAMLTHEASIGRISEAELNYLRARGISKQKAIKLIVAGFLKT